MYVMYANSLIYKYNRGKEHCYDILNIWCRFWGLVKLTGRLNFLILMRGYVLLICSVMSANFAWLLALAGDLSSALAFIFWYIEIHLRKRTLCKDRSENDRRKYEWVLSSAAQPRHPYKVCSAGFLWNIDLKWGVNQLAYQAGLSS